MGEKETKSLCEGGMRENTVLGYKKGSKSIQDYGNLAIYHLRYLTHYQTSLYGL